MTGAPAIRYPSGPVTPHGAYHLLAGKIPMLWLDAHDDSIRFDLMGGLSMIDQTRPESVHIKKDGLKGLVPPWKMVQQKGATQDGITFIDALGDPIEVQINAVARGRNGQQLRKVVRHLTGAIDPKKTAKLNFFTPDLGHWWSDVRWLKTLPGAMSGAQQHKQAVDLMLQADHGFWQTDPDVDSFGFDYEDMTDTFSTAYSMGLGPNWPLYYYAGTGGGYPRSNGDQAVWVDDPLDPILTDGRSVMFGPYKDFATTTDNQVVNMVLGSFQEWTFPDGAENHLWCRVGRNLDGTWNGYGVRASIGPFSIELSRFNAFTETTMALAFNLPSFPGEKYTIIAGFDDNPRHFQVQRNGLPVLDHVEAAGGSSPLGAAYRGIGAGMRAGGALITQATPAAIRKISGGDNAELSQTGFLERVNVGDQDMFDDYTVFGPATRVKFWNGPGSEDYVEYGPILSNEVMFLRTDPRDRQVQDLTTIPATPQELTEFQEAIKAFSTFASGGNVTALWQQFESNFGILSPLGPAGSRLKGRFSDAAAIPPKSPGLPVESYHVKVSIEGGRSTSRIFVSGTPLRRLPF